MIVRRPMYGGSPGANDFELNFNVFVNKKLHLPCLVRLDIHREPINCDDCHAVAVMMGFNGPPMAVIRATRWL